MKKRSRFLLVLAVLGVCFICLWPSIRWYFGTSKEDKDVALKSKQNIAEITEQQALDVANELIQMAKNNPDEIVPAQYKFLEKVAKANYKKYEVELPKVMTVSAMLKSFGFGYNNDFDKSKNNLREVCENYFFAKHLKDKDYYTKSVKLGLDLAGGVNVIIRADLDKAVADKGDALSPEQVPFFKQQAMATAIEVITSRIDQFGLTEPVIRQIGEDGIYIEIPGNDAKEDSLNAIINGTDMLQFRLVDDLATQTFYSSSTFDERGKVITVAGIPEDCELLPYVQKSKKRMHEDEDEFAGYMVCKKEVALNGSHIKTVTISSDKMGLPGVDLSLDVEGAVQFADVTAKNVKKRLAIVSDGKIKSAPTIKTAITGGQVRVDGFNTVEAQNLQKVLETASLDVPLSIESQQVVEATLGKISIESGIKALIIGLAAIMIFMLIFYKGSGFNAVVAQILNLYILFSILSAFNLTLTLPSIAGMILTIGMAVDANVIIFERIKEELRLGKPRKSAVDSGFKGAFWAIMDSNITTFIAALFLSVLGSGAIQGFAVSLAIGVLSSVFTALFVSRLMFDFGTDSGRKSVSIGWGIK